MVFAGHEKENKSMRNSTGRLSLAMAAFLAAASVLTAAQDGVPKGNLVQQLQKAYPLTVMDKKGKVTQAGAILVMKKEGLQANPPGMKYYYNDYQDGQIAAGNVSSATDTVKGAVISRAPWLPKSVKKNIDSRTLAVDEKVYLMRMDINPTSIDFFVRSCGDACRPDAPDPAHTSPYLAEVSFHFNKGYQNSDFSQVQSTINSVFALSDDASAGAAESAQALPAPGGALSSPAPAEAPLAPIAPPERPSPEPVRIGDTVEQVVAKWGTPDATVKLDTKEVYLYKDVKMKVTFVDGKVAGVE
jgi:hypothetical protein